MYITNPHTKSQPFIVHAPGGKFNPAQYMQQNPTWQSFQKLFNIVWPNIAVHERKDVAIITWNSKKKETILQECLKTIRCPYVVLGENLDRWNNKLKVSLTLDFLNTTSAKFVVGLDATDVICFDDPYKCVDILIDYNCKMLYGAELEFYPTCPPDHIDCQFENWKLQEQKIAINKYKYLQAGTWVGYTDYCKKVFGECKLKDHKKLNIQTKEHDRPEFQWYNQEQYLHHWVFLELYPETRLDNYCKCFQNITFHNFNDLHLQKLFI